jgi:20S proteasome alpha/beta subunit
MAEVSAANTGILLLNDYFGNLIISHILHYICHVFVTTTVILATDQSNAHSILVYQDNLDKISSLTDHSAMAVAGPNCDLINFTEYVAKNLQLYKLANDGTKLSVRAQANFARGELATALRRGPFQVNILLGGYDEKTQESSLYHLDYMGTLHKVNFGAQGYAAYFTLSIMDRQYKESFSEQEAITMVENCIKEMQKRFLLQQPNYMIKKVDKDGVSVVKFGQDPADT